MSKDVATTITQGEINRLQNKMCCQILTTVEPLIHISGKLKFYYNGKAMRTTDTINAICDTEKCIHNPDKCVQQLYIYSQEKQCIVWSSFYDIAFKQIECFGIKCVNSKMDSPLISAKLIYQKKISPCIIIEYLDQSEAIYSIGDVFMT
eukprot:58341_1